MTYIKPEFVMCISKEMGLIRALVFAMVQKTMDQIYEFLAKGGKVEFRNFGVLW